VSIQEGDKFPAFRLSDQSESVFTEADLIGKVSVLYFYPKDDTPG
jgi:peroxiredoxin Q/BCP